MKKLLPFVVLTIGLILSIVLHELFHVFMHLGHIQAIDIFPASGNIAQVVTDSAPGIYSTAVEELIAYGITIVVVGITMWLFINIITGKKRESK